jgi:hypothetical protein
VAAAHRVTGKVQRGQDDNYQIRSTRVAGRIGAGGAAMSKDRPPPYGTGTGVPILGPPPAADEYGVALGTGGDPYAVTPDLIQKGVELRAAIDTETVRALQLINGGMAAGLVTMLPTIIRDSAYGTLGYWMIAAIGFAALGLVAATIHNRLRRKCSLEHAKGYSADIGYGSWILRKCQSETNEPRVCTQSVISMWGSLILFCVGAIAIGTGFVTVHASAGPPAAACWDLQRLGDRIYKFNRCTGLAEVYAGK